MSTPNITEMGIVPMLSVILGTKTLKDLSPSKQIQSGERSRGTIESPLSRRLFAANSILGKYIENLRAKHRRLHEKNENGGPTEHDCKVFREKISRLRNRKDLLNGLFWQAVTEEYPQVIGNNANIRKGWLLVGEDGEWNNIVPVADKSAIANNFISRLAAIIRGRRVTVKGDGLDPVAQGEEVVGLLDDERVQTFHSMLTEINDELSKQLPSNLMNWDSEAIGEMTINELKRLIVLATHYKKLLGLASSLFWCGVRDTVPAAAELPTIGIRRDWNVVKCVPDADKERIEMNMTPMGPMITVDLSAFRSQGHPMR